MKLHIIVSICIVGVSCLSTIQAKPTKRKIRSAEELQFGNQQNSPGSVMGSGVPPAALYHGQKYLGVTQAKPEDIRNKEFGGVHFNEADEEIDGDTEEPLALPYYTESLKSPYHEAGDMKGSVDPKEISMARAFRSKRYKRDSRFIDLDSLSEEEFLKLLSIMRDYLKAEENLSKEKSYIPETLLEDISPHYPGVHLPEGYRKKPEESEYFIPNMDDSNEDVLEIPYSMNNFHQNRLNKRNYMVRDDIGYIPLPGQKRSFFAHQPGLAQFTKRRTFNEGEKIFALANMMAKSRRNSRSAPFFLPAAV